jgi:chemotaxis protein CheX
LDFTEYELDPKEYKLDLKEYEFDPKEYELDPKEYKLDLKEYELDLKEYELDLKEYKFDPKEYKFDSTEYKFDSTEYEPDSKESAVFCLWNGEKAQKSGKSGVRPQCNRLLGYKNISMRLYHGPPIIPLPHNNRMWYDTVMEKYIQPFIDVSRNVFKKFMGVEITANRPYFMDAEAESNWDISAIIGLTGEARGAVVISMKKELAARLTDILTGPQHNDLDAEIVDAIGEIVNIIAGNVKKNLEEAFRLIISLPTIVQGRQHMIKWPSGQARIICIPFTLFQDDIFILSVAIESAM